MGTMFKRKLFTFLNLFLDSCTISFKALCKELFKASLLVDSSESNDN